MEQQRYTAEEVDRAVQALTTDSERFEHSAEIVTHAAPGLQIVLAEALASGGWFEEAHDDQVTKAVGVADPGERERVVRTLLAEETRLGMLVGVAVGLELARELKNGAQ